MTHRDATSFDAIIIGTGQAGKPLAGALADQGQRVAIVERRERVGGTCVLDGCTPTKTMVASARVAYLARRAADYGVDVGPVRVDLSRVRERKRTIVDQWSSGSEKGLRRHDGVDLIFGHARFTGDRTVRVTLNDGGDRTLTAPRIFINTGTRNRVPELPGLPGVSWLDNRGIMELDRVPGHLLVLGGGFIGLEFAQMYRRFGARVTIVERGGHLVRREDEDVSEALRQILEEDGIEVRTGCRATRVETHGNGVRLHVEDDAGDHAVDATHLLVAVGREPNADDLGLEAAGIERDSRGFVAVDDQLRTTADGVWALGDVNGGPPFTHVAYDDFRVVRDALLGDGDGAVGERLLPYTLFTDPKLGRVGMTESEARARGLDIRVAKLPMNRVARAVEMDETRGFMKAIVERKSERILGAAILGVEGGEVAAVVQLAMLGGLPYSALRDGMLPHPTLAESLNNLFMAMEA